jgi:hypothetical protein
VGGGGGHPKVERPPPSPTEGMAGYCATCKNNEAQFSLSLSLFLCVCVCVWGVLFTPRAFKVYVELVYTYIHVRGRCCLSNPLIRSPEGKDLCVLSLPSQLRSSVSGDCGASAGRVASVTVYRIRQSCYI